MQVVGNVGDVKPVLVGLCVVYASGSKAGKIVGDGVVRNWPKRLVDKLYKKAQEISGYNDEDPAANQLGEALQEDDSPISLQQFKIQETKNGCKRRNVW